MTEAPQSVRSVLARLVWPIYAPMLLQSIGSAGITPLVPLIALRLGFSVPAASVLAMIAGIVAFLGPIPIGRVMSVAGERRTMVLSGVVLVATSLAGFAIIHDAELHGAGGLHRSGFVGVLVVSALCIEIWMLGRQSFMGTALPIHARARGMSMLGGMMRIGKVIGPVLGAAVVLVAHEGWVFVLTAVMAAAATVLVAARMVEGERDVDALARGSLGRSPVPADPSPYAPGRPAFATMVLAGLGVIPLSISRINRPLILPMVGASLGLDSATISLIFGVAAAVEIFMFVPAGTVMDRRGRAAVAVPCLVVSGLGYLLLVVLVPTIGVASHVGAIVAVAASTVLVAFGNGLGAGILMTLGIDLSPERMRTRHIARWNTITGLGDLGGPGIVALVTLVAPLTVAAVVTGLLALAGGAWLAKFLPAVTPSPLATANRSSGTLGP